MTDIHPEVASAKVCLISVTPDAEKHMGYVARVSNPNNQDNPKELQNSWRIASSMVTGLCLSKHS